MPKNPVDGVRVPNGIIKRDRRLFPGEYDALKEAALQCRNPLIWPVIQIAIETGMRRSEILSLPWGNVDLEARIVTLLDSKNGSGREIPLSMKAVNIFTRLSKDEDKAFPVSDYSIRHGWDRLVKRAGIKDLRFHDLRREATSRFFEKGLSVPEVATISGHKDFRMLSIYTKLRARSLVDKV